MAPGEPEDSETVRSEFSANPAWWLKTEICEGRNLPGGPVAKPLHSQCRGPGFDPWSGNWIPRDATKRL